MMHHKTETHLKVIDFEEHQANNQPQVLHNKSSFSISHHNNNTTNHHNTHHCFWGEDQIYQAAYLSSSVLFPYHSIRQIVHNPAIENRCKAVEWIRKILKNNSMELCETSINILDNFLLVLYHRDTQILSDSSFIAFAATASMILSSKLHNASNPINASTFSLFNTEDLLIFEQEIILKTASQMNTSISSISFLQYFISQCSDLTSWQKESLLSMAMELILEFREDRISLLFAPSTIAISALIVSLSCLQLHCQHMLEQLPDYFFPTSNNNNNNNENLLFSEEEDKIQYLNFEHCIQEMEKLPIVRSQYMNKTPDSIHDMC